MSPKSSGSGKKKPSQKSTKRSGAKAVAAKRRSVPARKPSKPARKPVRKPARKPAAKAPPKKKPVKAPAKPKAAKKPPAKAPTKAKPAAKPAAKTPAKPAHAPTRPSASAPEPPRRPPPSPLSPDQDDFEALRVGPATRDPYPTVIPRETQPSPPRVPPPPPKGGKPLVGPPPPGPRPVARHHTVEPLWDALPLPDEKAQLRRYYQGAQMPSPMGGFLEPLRVRTEDDGSGMVIFECSASSLRFALPIPAASRGEKKGVKDQQDAGEDPVCPRHEPPLKLNRVGPVLMCSLCGVRYGRV